MTGILSIFLGLAFFAGIALAFGFIANFALKRSSPIKRAAIASGLLGFLLCLPAFAALINANAPLVSIMAIVVGVFIMAAFAFPLVLIITKRKEAEPDDSVFD